MPPSTTGGTRQQHIARKRRARDAEMMREQATTMGGKPRASVKWEDPPAKRTHEYDWAAIAVQLQAAPGEWGKVFDEDRLSYVIAMRQGAIKALRPSRGFEFRQSNTNKAQGICTLFVRYVPTKDQGE